MAKFSIKGGIDFDNADLKKGLNDSEKRVNKLGSTFSKVGSKMAAAFTVGAITSLTSNVIKNVAEIENSSRKVGVSTRFYQAWTRAVEASGGSISNAIGALADLRIRQDEAIRGNQTAIDSFQGLGITLEQVMSSSVEDLIGLVGKAVIATGNWSDAAKVLGTDNLKEINTALLEISTDGIPEYIAGLEKAGLIMDREITEKLAKADRLFARMSARMKVYAAEVVGYTASIFGKPKVGAVPFSAAITTSVASQISQKTAADVRASLAKPPPGTPAIDIDAYLNSEFKKLQDLIKATGALDFSPSGAFGAMLNARIGNLRGGLGSGPKAFTDLRRIGGNILGSGEAKAAQHKEFEQRKKQIEKLEAIRANTEGDPASKF